jgi:NAD(P)-dependent dehydrogenase (short-subunit alcohol dehydrogenase family)
MTGLPTIVLTGGTSGIGLAAAPRLAARAGRLILVARNPAKVADAQAAIATQTGRRDVDIVYGDLSSLADVRRIAAEIAALTPTIDVLINNAGLYLGAAAPTADGHDTVHAVNTLAPLLLTAELWPLLLRSQASRVVNVASVAHRWGRLNLEDLAHTGAWAPMRAYAAAKLQTVMWTMELAARAGGSPVVPVSVHPGAIASNFAQEGGGVLGPLMRIGRFVLSSTDTGAAPILELALDRQLGAAEAGRYFHRHRPAGVAGTARRPELRAKLWGQLCDRVGLPADWPLRA